MQFLGLHGRGTCLTVYVCRAVGIGGRGGGVDWPSKIAADQLNLFQPGGQIIPITCYWVPVPLHCALNRVLRGNFLEIKMLQ